MKPIHDIANYKHLSDLKNGKLCSIVHLTVHGTLYSLFTSV